jgi:hypothetical protein
MTVGALGWGPLEHALDVTTLALRRAVGPLQRESGPNVVKRGFTLRSDALPCHQEQAAENDEQQYTHSGSP